MLVALAVVAGLLGMHGLAPGSSAEVSTGVVRGQHTSAPHSSAHHVVAQVPGPDNVGEHCAHSAQDQGGGHAEHADPTCAAGGLGVAFVLPAPAMTGVAAQAPSGRSRDAVTAVPRTPPSLAELQLLRI